MVYIPTDAEMIEEGDEPLTAEERAFFEQYKAEHDADAPVMPDRSPEQVRAIVEAEKMFLAHHAGADDDDTDNSDFVCSPGWADQGAQPTFMGGVPFAEAAPVDESATDESATDRLV